VVDCPSIRDAAFGCAHGLIRKSLQPENPCKEGARGDPQVVLKANNVRPVVGSGVLSEHAFKMPPRSLLVAAEKMLRRADQSVAD
jgi:hypothetical protein